MLSFKVPKRLTAYKNLNHFPHPSQEEYLPSSKNNNENEETPFQTALNSSTRKIVHSKMYVQTKKAEQIKNDV